MLLLYVVLVASSCSLSVLLDDDIFHYVTGATRYRSVQLLIAAPVGSRKLTVSLSGSLRLFLAIGGSDRWRGWCSQCYSPKHWRLSARNPRSVAEIWHLGFRMLTSLYSKRQPSLGKLRTTPHAPCCAGGQCRGPVTPSLMQYQAKPNFDKYSPEGRHGLAGRIERNAILVPSLMPRW